MVQVEPNLTLTLKHLAPCGVVLSAEHQAALDHSLPIKKVEAGLKSLVLWGRITVLNGKDYLVAEGYNSALLKNSTEVVYETKYFYSQDGARWDDLQPVNAETSKHAARIRGPLSGVASNIYDLEEPNPAKPGDDGEEPAPIVYHVPELAVLRWRVDQIARATSIVPTNCMTVNAQNTVVVNRMFGGCQFPDKLESYQHRSAAPSTGGTLAKDLRGTWAVHYDAFKGVAQVRSLLWPGYFFFYSANDVMWGSMYLGDGLRNNDLVFML